MIERYTNGHNPKHRDDGDGRDDRELERTSTCGKRIEAWWCLRDHGHAGDCGGPPDFAADIAHNIAESYRPNNGDDDGE